MTDNMVTALSADWLSNHTQVSTDSDIDQELLLHYTFKSSLKGNYSCPLDGSMENALDVGFSSGVWMMEMSSEFPRCNFFGIDPKPRSPDLVYPDNCLFGEGDFLKQPLPYSDQKFDLVHLRLILFTLGADQMDVLLGEVGRVTKPKGYIEFLEPLLSSSNLGGPLLNKLLFIWSETIVNDAVDDQFCDKLDKSLAERGFSKPVVVKVSIPLGKWGGMVGDFSLAALKLFISNSDHIKSKLNLHDENELSIFLGSVEKECEQFKPHIDVYSGFAQKL